MDAATRLTEQLLFYAVVLGWELGLPLLTCAACRTLLAPSAQAQKGAVGREDPAEATPASLQPSIKEKIGRYVTLPAVTIAVMLCVRDQCLILIYKLVG